MLRFVFLIAICGMLTGCLLFPASTTVSGLPPIPVSGVGPTEVGAVQPGSKVEILWEHDGYRSRTVGEVLHASPQGIALMNARIEHRDEHAAPVMNKVPYVSRLFKNTGVGVQAVPVHWVPILQMTSTSVLDPPPEGYVAPQLAINTTAGVEFERIGIDFDFNTGDVFESPVVTESAP